MPCLRQHTVYNNTPWFDDKHFQNHVSFKMAEAAPLTSAHAHARKAAKNTQEAHWSEAADEYLHAAHDFARASKDTTDGEARRVLKLLEEQNQRIARIIQSRDASIEHDPVLGDYSSSPGAATKVDVGSPSGMIDKAVASSKTKSPTSAIAGSAQIGSHSRDASPSLARDIASRRGIPGSNRNSSLPAVQTRPQPLSPDSHRRTRSGLSNSKIPPSIVDSQHNLGAQSRKKPKSAEDDEGFAKFYSNITTGTMSKLSSVLAYAGLPLTAEDSQTDQTPDLKAGKKRVSASNDPDVKKIFSKAALDAIEEEHRRRGTLGHGFGPAESFYVVPNSGGTMSYAEMARNQHQLSNIGEDDEDSFVDAREMPGPPSPRHSRRPSSQQNQRGSFGKARTGEELELENTTLKATLEQVAKRLQNFEAHAQDASMAALTQSMIGFRPANTAPPADSVTQKRLRQVEKQLEETTEENKKYKAYLEKLKNNAKARRESRGAKGPEDASTAEGVDG
ncbi:Hypothetical protein R9X50_00588800 [Acrodontium crateriforme]|uniref:MIT domain-containing protein n=1 Tax=Acrodontium crateriforme TaxID=150365 RepID=A0AAQ3R9H2_9PEZI|nr:Hypothetical protein R9X50_00588800 [Acrodontium crateriforme]